MRLLMRAFGHLLPEVVERVDEPRGTLEQDRIEGEEVVQLVLRTAERMRAHRRRIVRRADLLDASADGQPLKLDDDRVL